jgi:hypothetical protein
VYVLYSGVLGPSRRDRGGLWGASEIFGGGGRFIEIL